MPRFSAGWRTGGAGSATLPMAGILGNATYDIYVVEIGVTNTTVTAFECSLKRITAAGTAGASQTVVAEDGTVGATAIGDPRDLWTVAPTLVAGEVRRASIGASVGSGVIWTFGARGLRIANSAATGVVLMPITGTGQQSDVYFSWDA